jgi:predicted negative regulator of RcsB-dependent stress response
MTRTGEAARPQVEDDTEGFIDWARDHGRELSFAVLAIVTIAAAAWLYGYSVRRNVARAQMLLGQAEATMGAQRLPEAQTQLERLVQNFEGTPAAGQGLLRLAQLLYEQGKYEDGVRRLEGAFAEYDEGPFAAALRQLAGAGYEQMAQPARAAERYAEAARLTTLEGERDQLLGRAARAWADAGNKDEAIRLWKGMAERPDHPLGNEARIRLGELTATPATSAERGS